MTLTQPQQRKVEQNLGLVGKVIKVGNTSLKVEVEVFVESMSADGREKAIQGVFSFVAIDADKRPVPVLPGFVD